MQGERQRAIAAALMAVASALLLLGNGLAEPPAPKLVLWAWDRAEDLRFLAAGEDVEVAFLAGTIHLRGERIELRPRRSPLALRDSTRRTPVVRIEADRGDRPRLDGEQRGAVVARIGALIDLEAATALQIDFDAPLSARPFYRALLADLRARLPRGAHLSMTALASWCLGDDWLGALDVDEAVPMFFRMGPDAGAARAWLARGTPLAEKCAESFGIALDEPLPARGSAAAVYAFSARSWTADEYASLRRRLAEPRL
jgi:hypothetical protein